MTSFTDLVGCARPLQLAGMGGVSTVELAAAVTNAGGLGMMGVAGVPVDMLGDLLDELDAKTDGPFGVNFLMPFLDRAALEFAASRCRVVEFFYDDPVGELVEIAHARGALVSWQVGSIGEAKAAVDVDCDLVVVQGTEAGGHIRGTESLESLLHAVGDLGVPIVAAGGIGTANDVSRCLNAGASAIRAGTRFIAAEESSAHDSYVDALVRASAADTIITEEFDNGWPNAPARVLRSSLDAARAATDGSAFVSIGDQEWPVPRFSTMPPTREAHGNIGAMPHYAGFSVDAVHVRQPAAEIVDELMREI
jgi:nitronate monooxygenase